MEDGQLTVFRLCTREKTAYVTEFGLCFSLTCIHVLTRFLVHRYSVMRENVEANKIEGVDDVDTHYMDTGKAQYNEDSDQVCDPV